MTELIKTRNVKEKEVIRSHGIKGIINENKITADWINDWFVSAFSKEDSREITLEEPDLIWTERWDKTRERGVRRVNFNQLKVWWSSRVHPQEGTQKWLFH